jgi:hypothetical protein
MSRRIEFLVTAQWWEGSPATLIVERPSIHGTVGDAEQKALAAQRRIENTERAAERIEVDIYRRELDVTYDSRSEKEIVREILRAHVSTLGADGLFVDHEASDRVGKDRHEQWLAVVRDDMRQIGSPALPPDAVKRAGKDAIAEWYRERMDAAERRHVERRDLMDDLGEVTG